MSQEPLAWLDGRILPAKEARLPVLDLGVRLGLGAFETVRVENGRAFDLEAHVRLLERSLHALRIEPAARVEEAVRALLERWGPRSGALRMQRTAGDPPALPPALLVTIEPPRALPEAAREKGVAVITLPADSYPLRPDVENHKTTSYARRAVARREAQARGAYEAIFVDPPEGRVRSGAYSNVVWVSGGALRHAGAVWLAKRDEGHEAVHLMRTGTTLRRLLRIAEAEKLPQDLGGALASSDEAFLCNSLIGVLPIASVDGHPLPRSPGPITLRLASLLESEVRAECGLV